MKSIQLTEEHKSKLLEMCKILFPEYFFDEEGEDYYIDENNIINFLIPIKENEFKGGEIHWFEFCMTWLSHKIIFNPNNKLSACNHNHAGLLESTMSIFYGEKHGIHPVDYLYEEFLKLK